MTTQATATLAVERFDRIRDLVREHRVMRVESLAEALGVSPVTVRRDLSELEGRGLLRKVHGGAVSVEGTVDEPGFDDKASLAAQEKQAIAEAALKLVQPGDCVYLDGGSTVLALAHLLTSRHDITVVTNSLRVAQALAGSGPRTILLGGELRRLSQTFIGSLSEPVLSRLSFDKAFMGTIGLALERGLTTTDPDEAFTKQLVMKRARHVILLADSSKAGKVAFARAGGVEEVQTLITDGRLDARLAAGLKKRGVDVVKVGTPKTGGSGGLPPGQARMTRAGRPARLTDPSR